jgi:hypothetical protein
MRFLVSLLFLCTSLANAVDSNRPISELSMDAEYCKVNYSSHGDKGVYRGQCNNNQPHGAGTVTYRNGDVIEGTFDHGVMSGGGDFTSANGNTYQGNWHDGLKHGDGTFTWAKGSTYSGQWVDDKRHGRGTFVWSNGNRFEGEFRNNKKYNGKYYTSTGKVYKCRLGRCR